MVKHTSFIFISFLLLSCGGSESSESSSNLNNALKYADGKNVYMNSCIVCHQASGEGVAGAFPPLAESDYLLADINRAIDIAANGMEGKITVNDVDYDAIMASQSLSNEEVRDVLNFVLNSWGNDGGEVTIQQVQDVVGGE